jgi:lauroyl/myristoyl acyltransferase
VSWLISLPLGLLMVLGPNLLHALFGGAWDGAAWTLRILCLAAYLRVAGPACVPTLIVFGRPQLLWRVQVAQLLGMALLLYPLAQVAGVEGCAVAVALPILIGTIYLLRVSMSLAGVHSAEVLPLTFAGPAAGLGCGLIAYMLPADSTIGTLLQLVVAVALWVAVTSAVSPTMRGIVARIVPLVRPPASGSSARGGGMGTDSASLPVPESEGRDALWRRLARTFYGSQLTHRLLPWAAARHIADLQTAYRWHNPAIRELARAHAEFLLGESSRRGDVPHVAHAYARQYARLAERRWRPWLTTRQRVERVEVLQEAIRTGRGVILSFLHHGDFYSMFPSLNLAGVTGIHTAAAPFHFVPRPKFFHRQGLRTATSRGGVEVFNAVGSFDHVCELLRMGKPVGLACDMPGSLPVTFLGRQVLAAPGTPVAALRTGALIVPVTAHSEGDGQFLRVMDPIDPHDHQDPASLLQAVLDQHEGAVLEWPEVLQLPLTRWNAPEQQSADHLVAVGSAS